MVTFLNQDLLFLEFEIPEEAKWVLKLGRRWFRGGSLNLEWWSLDSSCVNSKEKVREAWIRVVRLPLHLWRQGVLKKIDDSCGVFLAIDKETTLGLKVAWSRILVKIEGMVRQSVVNIMEGARSFEV